MKPTDRQREIFTYNFNYLALGSLDTIPTQEDLAKLLGVSQTSISSWLVGQKFPRASTLDKIAKLYDVTVNELVNVDLSKVLFDTWIEETHERYKEKEEQFLSDIKKAKDDDDGDALAESLGEYFDYISECEDNNTGIVLDYDLLFSNYSSLLNRIGKRKTIEYIRDLISISKYRKGKDEHEET